MYTVGEKIVHPMHGAGTVVEILEKNVLGETKDYYKIQMMLRGIEILVPVDRCEEIGIRSVMSENEYKELLEILDGKMSKMPKNWNQRYRANMERIKTGDILELGSVVRNLMLLDTRKGLSAGEKRMLIGAKQMMISEIMSLTGESVEKVEADVDRHVLDSETKN